MPLQLFAAWVEVVFLDVRGTKAQLLNLKTSLKKSLRKPTGARPLEFQKTSGPPGEDSSISGICLREQSDVETPSVHTFVSGD